MQRLEFAFPNCAIASPSSMRCASAEARITVAPLRPTSLNGGRGEDTFSDFFPALTSRGRRLGEAGRSLAFYRVLSLDVRRWIGDIHRCDQGPVTCTGVGERHARR